MSAAPVTDIRPTPLGLIVMRMPVAAVIAETRWTGVMKYCRIARMTNWTAVKTARVTAMAGTVRRMSIPAAAPRVKAKAA